ncbi:MAG: hypothetical protein ACE5IR_27765, partial [bacterium]
LIYEYERLNLVSSTIQVAHNFLLGAGACGVVWGQKAQTGQEFSDVGHDLTTEIHEIRGVKKIVPDITTPEDYGLVNVFSAAIAD